MHCIAFACFCKQAHDLSSHSRAVHLHCSVAQTVISPICTCAGLEEDATAELSTM